jgi:hypothetical protein
MEGFTDGLLQINECIYYICLHISTFSCTPENEYLLHKKSLRTVSVHPQEIPLSKCQELWVQTLIILTNQYHWYKML